MRYLSLLFSTLLLLVHADKGPGSGGGGGSDKPSTFVATMNGAPIREGARFTAPIIVRGTHVGFDIDPGTLGVRNYFFTGAPDPRRMVTTKTNVYLHKTPTLTAAQRANPIIDRIEVEEDDFEVRINVAGGKVKVQAKDMSEGGLLQFEPELGAGSVEFVKVLDPGMFYFVNPFTNKINFGNGIPADSTHDMFLGKDSPEAATQTFQDGSTSKWTVLAGGRLGSVFGHDATEQGGAGSDCTSDCQKQNRVRGSLPVPPNPTVVTPLPVATPLRNGA